MITTPNHSKHVKPAILVIVVFLIAGCSSTTLIQSSPSGAEVYVQGQHRGTTPYSYTDSKIAGSSTSITLKKAGYEDMNVRLTRDERADVGAIVAGCFVLVPFLWLLQYDVVHSYELQEVSLNKEQNQDGSYNVPQSTAELVKLENLLDLGAITKEEFTTLKVRILESKYNYDQSIPEEITKLKELRDKNLLTEEEYKEQKSKLIEAK